MPGQPVIRWRAFGLGMALCVVIGLWGPWGVCVLSGSRMFHFNSNPGAQFLLFLTVLVTNVAVGRVWPAARLSRAELALVAVMILVAASLPTTGVMSHLMSSMGSPYYYASAENRWHELVLPHLEKSLAPLDQTAGSFRGLTEPVRLFFEGLDRGDRLPWEAWLRPLALYMIVLAGLYLVMISMMVILRRQWIDNERLAYPIAQLPRDLIEAGQPDGPPSIFRRPVFWLAVVLVFAYYSHFALTRHMPEAFPTRFLLRYRAWAFDRTFPLDIFVWPSVMGFAFLIDRRVAFSLWVFSLLTTVEGGLLHRFGVASAGHLGTFVGTGTPNVAHQGAGALVAFVAACLWAARGHLRDVAHKARHGIDDGNEIIPYRTAVVLMAVGLAVMVGWLVWAGLNVFWAAVFVFAALIVFLGLSRTVCESGMFLFCAPIVAPTLVTSGVGSEVLGAAAVVTLTICWPWCADARTTVITSSAHGLRLAEFSGVGGRRIIFWAILAAIAVTIVACTAMLLRLGYEYGGINLRGWLFITSPRNQYSNAAALIAHPTGPDWIGWTWKGIGAAVVGLLVWANRVLANWPLHPVGFVVAHIGYIAQCWFSVFLAWLAKVVLVRYGGPRGYRWGRPFFIGLILGEFTAGGFWFVVDLVTGYRGNKLF